MYICPPHLYTVATLPWDIQKSHFSTVLFIYTSDYLRCLRKTNCYPLPTIPEKCHLVKLQIFHLFIFSRVLSTIHDTDELQKRLVATWAEFQHSMVDDAVDQWRKDWKHVSVQNVVTLNICCDIACLTFHLPYITTGSFQSHHCQPTTGFFQSHQRLEECNIP